MGFMNRKMLHTVYLPEYSHTHAIPFSHMSSLNNPVYPHIRLCVISLNNIIYIVDSIKFKSQVRVL